ncbi:hypothetical protein [uncultured Polaribacter sp.]|uniref:hypothetical protein n=1 Tax=uncultured Polaribacter sp. TaxID=174711 RepID=UPI0026035C14|nr:hypothetical protein [uncultured Polaribacter sp.]
MKPSIKKTLLFPFALIFLFSFYSCSKEDVPASVYDEIGRYYIAKKITEMPPVDIIGGYSLAVGDIYLYKTSSAYYGKLEVLQIAVVTNFSILTIKATTYKENGTIFNETTSNNLVLLDTFYCDLDTMEKNANTSNTNDFIWDGTDQVIQKRNGAVFLKYD